MARKKKSPLTARTFGKRVEAIRLTKGLTVYEACRKIRMDPSNWRSYERGDKTPGLYVLFRILNGLGVSWKEFGG